MSSGTMMGWPRESQQARAREKERKLCVCVKEERTSAALCTQHTPYDRFHAEPPQANTTFIPQANTTFIRSPPLLVVLLWELLALLVVFPEVSPVLLLEVHPGRARTATARKSGAAHARE